MITAQKDGEIVYIQINPHQGILYLSPAEFKM